MKVKRFTAPTMAEALKQVKATLGPDAVILETTEAAADRQAAAAPMCEPGSTSAMTAAVAEPDPATHPAAPGLAARVGSPSRATARR